MATKQRAEVEVIDSEKNRHTFRLGTGAICHLEESTGLDIMQIFKLLTEGGWKLSLIRDLVRSSSLDKPDMSMTVEEANELVDAVGVGPLLNAFVDSIILTFNAKNEKKGTKPGTAENPPRAGRRRPGAGSSSAPPKSDS